MEEKDKPIITYMKNTSNNKIVIPKKFIEKNGTQYYMQVFDDKIILTPVKKEK